MDDALALRSPISEDQKLVYAGIWLLKKMDLELKDGGMEVPVGLSASCGGCGSTVPAYRGRGHRLVPPPCTIPNRASFSDRGSRRTSARRP